MKLIHDKISFLKMAPGHYNPHSKNFGGLHTGTGKYQNGGPYANNGYRMKRISHTSFKEGSKVAYLGSNKRLLEALGNDKDASTGTVVSKNDSSVNKGPRSCIRVIFPNGTIAYIHKRSLSLVDLEKPTLSYKNKERENIRETRRKRRFRMKYPEKAAELERKEQEKLRKREEERALKNN
tara:strand:+ start:238 stop:777 length:540 start_codon:yes stop_codon:yes gene_type:complete